MYKKEYILKWIKSKKSEKLVSTSNIFGNIEITIENVKYTIKDNSDNLKIILESKSMDNRKLNEYFFKLYAYINIVVGYYPKLLSGVEFDVKNSAEKYKTGEKHIHNDVCFTCRISSDNFKKSYGKFLNLYNKISFQIDYYSIATSKIGDWYCQIAIVNILQCLDGLYNCLEITEKKRYYLTKKQTEKIQKKVKNIGLSNITRSKNTKDMLKLRLEQSVININEENYDTKLTNIFNDIESKYKVFHFENDEKFRKFIIKCKKTRNKFSHASNEINNEFNGLESTFYLYKLILVFRLLIIDEIGLGKLIDRELLKRLIINIGIFKCKMLIDRSLNKEGGNNGQ